MTLLQIVTILIIPLCGTVLGSASALLFGESTASKMQKTLLGFASGVMVAASVWSLLIPAIDMGSVWPVVVGLLGGFAFLLLIDYITPHIHPKGGHEGPQSHLSRTTMLALAVTIHNFPEGMAVGVVFAGWLAGNAQMSLAGAMILAIGIAIQNFPEGAMISVPIYDRGIKKGKCHKKSFN